MTLEEVQELLKGGNIAPSDCANYKAELAGWYSFFAGVEEDLLAKRPDWWIKERPNYKSDKATDRAYEATPDGIALMKTRSKMKRIEKMISSLSSLLRTKEVEAKNIY